MKTVPHIFLVMQQRQFNNIAARPKKLFLIDGLCALVSTILYLTLLVNLESTFGIPKTPLYLFAMLATGYNIYSFTCYGLALENWRPYLQVIGIANLLHSLLTLAMLFYYQESLTLLGVFYFVGEVLIVSSLAIIEIKIARHRPKVHS